MDPVSMAAYMVQADMLLTQGNIGVAMIKQAQVQNDEVVSMISGSATVTTPYALEGTGQIVNVLA
jgi:hypothetical protein